MAASTRPRSRRRKPLPQGPRSTPEKIQEFRLPSPRLRLVSVWLVLLLGMLGLAGRLAYLQLVIADDLKVMAKEQQATQPTPRTARRQIIDRQGNVVALDQVVYTLYVHPIFSKSLSQ